jgi:hypothetical protein
MKKVLFVIVIVIVGYFAYKFYQEKVNKGLGSIDFEEIVIEEKLEVAKDESEYHFERYHDGPLITWIKIQTEYYFEVPFYVDCKNLAFKNISDSTITVVIKELTADAIENERFIDKKVSSGGGWNEKANHANSYLLDHIPDMAKTIKKAEYTDFKVENLDIDKWKKSAIKDILKNPDRLDEQELIRSAEEGMKELMKDFIKGLELTKNQKIKIHVEIDKLNVFGATRNI